MSMTPMLGDYELPRVTRLETLEKRDFAELQIPGRAGNLFHDLDRQSARVLVEGSLFGNEPGQDFLEAIRGRYLDGEPLTFVSDIVTGTEIQYVLIEQLHVQAAASHPDQIDYALWLLESPPAPPPGDLLGDIDASLLDQAAGMLDTATGALDALDALGSVPELSDPTVPLGGMLDEVSGALASLDEIGSALQGLLGR